MLSHDRFPYAAPTTHGHHAVAHYRTAMDTLVLKFSRWRSRKRGFRKSRTGRAHRREPGGRVNGQAARALISEHPPQVVERPLRGPCADAIAVAK